MSQLIPLMLILASLTVLAVQNRSISLPLVILSSETPAIPVGLLLVGAICMGALITLILYGLMGLIRPPESKYRPMGRRVPYPDGSGSTAVPDEPALGSSSPPVTTYNPADAAYTGGSPAFVSDPTDTPTTLPNSPSNPIQDSLTEDGPQGDRINPSSTSPNTSTNAQGTTSTFGSFFGGQSPSTSPPSAKPQSTINEAPNVKKKTKRTRGKPKKEKIDRQIGNDWSDFRPAGRRNSWDPNEEPSYAATGTNAEQPRGLFDFMRPGSSAHESASRLASDIAAGWTGQPHEPMSQSSGRLGYDSGYDGRYDSDYNRDYKSGYDGSYDPEGYRPGHYDDTYSSGEYDRPNDDDLDRGWESFDHYDAPPPPDDLGEGKRRVYGDSLYGDDSREVAYDARAYPEEAYRDEPYPADRFPEEPLNEIGPDGVYEADYRVIVPPSKPLDDSDNYTN